MAGFADKIEEVGVALVILAILVGGVAIPLFLDVNITGLSTVQATVWGVILTLSFLGIGLGAIAYMRGARKKGR